MHQETGRRVIHNYLVRGAKRKTKEREQRKPIGHMEHQKLSKYMHCISLRR